LVFVRVPRPRGPRPKPSPFEPIVTDTEVFHPVRSAAHVIDKGVRTVNKLNVPFETFPGGHHFYKESVLRAELEKLAEEKLRARAAGERNRRDAAAKTHTKHATWVDEFGNSQPLDAHPNEPVCRNLFRRLSKTPELLCDDWLDRARLTYELTDEIGICPPGHRPETVVPGDVYSPETVLFVPISGPRKRVFDVLEIEARRLEAERQRIATTGRSGDFDTRE
jgi:hypothetical protein